MLEGALNCKRLRLVPIHVPYLSGLTYLFARLALVFATKAFEAWLEWGIYSTLTPDPPPCHGTIGVQMNTL